MEHNNTNGFNSAAARPPPPTSAPNPLGPPSLGQKEAMQPFSGGKPLINGHQPPLGPPTNGGPPPVRPIGPPGPPSSLPIGPPLMRPGAGQFMPPSPIGDGAAVAANTAISPSSSQVFRPPTSIGPPNTAGPSAFLPRSNNLGPPQLNSRPLSPPGAPLQRPVGPPLNTPTQTSIAAPLQPPSSQARFPITTASGAAPRSLGPPTSSPFAPPPSPLPVSSSNAQNQINPSTAFGPPPPKTNGPLPLQQPPAPSNFTNGPGPMMGQMSGAGTGPIGPPRPAFTSAAPSVTSAPQPVTAPPNLPATVGQPPNSLSAGNAMNQVSSAAPVAAAVPPSNTSSSIPLTRPPATSTPQLPPIPPNNPLLAAPPSYTPAAPQVGPQGPAPPIPSTNGPPSLMQPYQQPPQQMSRPRYPSYPPPPTQTSGIPTSSGPMSNGMPPPMHGSAQPPPPLGNTNGPLPPQLGPPPVSGAGGMMPPPPTVNGQPPPPGAFQSKYGDVNHISNKLGNLSVTQQGFRKLWGQDTLDLLQNRHILPPDKVSPPEIRLQTEQWNSINCDKDIFRCTLNRIPETDALLKKARLPLGVLIHPYKDLSHLPVIQCSTIVRCRSCRTYINPFVHFVDQRRWRCNLCYRVNELPEEFLYDPVSKTYGDPSRRPECKSSTIEFIAPSEYMLRPPQPAVYLFLLDVSRQALDNGYLRNFCDILLDELDKLPGDGRTQLGFITYDRTLQFYMMPEGASQVSQMIVGDIDDVFLPSPSDLLINLQSCREQIVQMLNELPELFNGTHEVESCLGAALKAAYKMISPTGGRITILQGSLPNLGPGALTSREGGQQKDKIDSGLLGPTTDFYKKLALECSGQQVAVDLFVLSNQHVDLATISGISKFSGGQVSSFIGYHSHKNLSVAEKFDKAFRRYLTRKIGFESVMRIRCTRGMSLHTFHGHFFVRSTDLLSLPNVNPDAGFGMQVSIDEDLKDSREVSFQAALLYTSSKGERRIRVHTLCLPTSNSLQEIVQGADQQCIVGLLAKMAVDRSLNASIYDAKEAFINACIDIISRWRMVQCANQPGALLVSPNLSLVPLYILALLKSFAFTQRSGVPLDERTMSMINMKCLPLTGLIQSMYPDLYRVDQLEKVKTIEDEEGILIPDPDRIQLSAENIAMSGVYLMDLGDIMYLYLGKVTSSFFCEKIFGVNKVMDVDENLLDLPELDNEDSERLRALIHHLNNKKSHPVPIKIVRDDSNQRHLFISMLIDDRSQASYSYYELLQQLKSEIK